MASQISFGASKYDSSSAVCKGGHGTFLVSRIRGRKLKTKTLSAQIQLERDKCGKTQVITKVWSRSPETSLICGSNQLCGRVLIRTRPASMTVNAR